MFFLATWSGKLFVSVIPDYDDAIEAKGFNRRRLICCSKRSLENRDDSKKRGQYFDRNRVISIEFAILWQDLMEICISVATWKCKIDDDTLLLKDILFASLSFVILSLIIYLSFFIWKETLHKSLAWIFTRTVIVYSSSSRGASSGSCGTLRKLGRSSR